MSKIVLGFDVSSTTIGWCALAIDGYAINFISAGYIKPIKDGSIIERIVDTRNRISDIINSVKPDYIGIEDIIQFMEGKSSAQTIIMLTTFNRMVGLLSHDYLGKAPCLFNVLSIRHGLKINKIFPKKDDMPELVAKHLGITFPYEFGKRGKIAEESYDKADGIAVALYYAFVLINKVKPPKIKIDKPKKLKKPRKTRVKKP